MCTELTVHLCILHNTFCVPIWSGNHVEFLCVCFIMRFFFPSFNSWINWRTLGMIQRWFIGPPVFCLSSTCSVKSNKPHWVCAHIRVKVCFLLHNVVRLRWGMCVSAYMQIAWRCLHFSWLWWLKSFSLTLCCCWPHYFLRSQISRNKQDLSHISHCVKVNLTMKKQIHENHSFTSDVQLVKFLRTALKYVTVNFFVT